MIRCHDVPLNVRHHEHEGSAHPFQPALFAGDGTLRWQPFNGRNLNTHRNGAFNGGMLVSASTLEFSRRAPVSCRRGTRDENVSMTLRTKPRQITVHLSDQRKHRGHHQKCTPTHPIAHRHPYLERFTKSCDVADRPAAKAGKPTHGGPDPAKHIVGKV